MFLSYFAILANATIECHQVCEHAARAHFPSIIACRRQVINWNHVGWLIDHGGRDLYGAMLQPGTLRLARGENQAMKGAGDMIFICETPATA